MNRLLEFRFWDIKKNQFIEFPHVFLDAKGQPKMAVPIFHTLKNVIVQQFTGLTDKNSKKIFEGDIISFAFEKETFVVKFGIFDDFNYKCEGTNLKGNGFFFESQYENRQYSFGYTGKDCVVTGNIFDK